MVRRKARAASAAWARLEREIVACTRCPRLRAHCEQVARARRRAFRDQEYWGRPVPGFGDRQARILLVGLAPAAHGANRTGRMFTGDGSGDWLYGALHRAGLASQPTATHRDDGLSLAGVYVSAAGRCAPPDNRPSPEELASCASFLDREIDLLGELRVAVALGRIAWDAVLRRVDRVAPRTLGTPRPAFAHGARTRVALRGPGREVWLVASYHPSRQNTQTGRLTRPMLDSVIGRAKRLAAGSGSVPAARRVLAGEDGA
jgi:uracil-DNA glycosylase family 4